MQIDLFGAAAVTGIGLENRAAAKSAVSPSSSGAVAVPEDTASLSSSLPSVPSLASQVLASAQSRQAKVEALRQAVANAEYSLDPALIADAMISEST